jgi:nucleoside 2-deoxyribosyltransferase
MVSALMDVLSRLRRPVAFGVRLLNPKVDGFIIVDNFFTDVVRQVVEEELGYELVVVDGNDNKEPFTNQEIFNRLHRASVVIVDLTGERPNCFIELGYALGRGLPTMLCVHDDNSTLPFNINPVPTHRWNESESREEQRRKFRNYWRANAQRRQIVQPDPLIR